MPDGSGFPLVSAAQGWTEGLGDPPIFGNVPQGAHFEGFSKLLVLFATVFEPQFRGSLRTSLWPKLRLGDPFYLPASVVHCSINLAWCEYGPFKTHRLRVPQARQMACGWCSFRRGVNSRARGKFFRGGEYLQTANEAKRARCQILLLGDLLPGPFATKRKNNEMPTHPSVRARGCFGNPLQPFG